MVTSTLPVFDTTPSFVFFHTLDVLALAIMSILMSVAFESSMVSVVLLTYSLTKSGRNRKTSRKDEPNGRCRSCMKTVFLPMGRQLCALTFPALFKLHKTRSGDDNKTRKFMVLLDREVESNLTLVAAFCSIAYSIFCSSTMVFLRYFPVEESAECLEKDSHGRSLFCYSNSSLINSSLPVDCANYTVTELKELTFECYAISIPGFGIAVAAALGLAKVAILGITIYVKVTEWVFMQMLTLNLPQKLQEKCCHKFLIIVCVDLLYIILSFILLSGASSFILFLSVKFIEFHAKTDSHPLHLLYYYAYIILPLLILYPLMYVTVYLSFHCHKGEYTSFAADQSPPDPRDRDEDPETSLTKGQHDEDPNENDMTLLIEARDDIKLSEYGTIRC